MSANQGGISENLDNSFEQEKTSANLFIISGIVLACAVVFGLGGFLLGRQSISINQMQVVITPSVEPTNSIIVPTTTTTQLQNNIDTSDWQEVVNSQLGISFKMPVSWQSKVDTINGGTFLTLGPDVNQSTNMGDGFLIYASGQGLDGICHGPAWMTENLEAEGIKIITSTIYIDGQTGEFIECFEDGELSETMVYFEKEGINEWDFLDFRFDSEVDLDVEKQILASIELQNK